MRTPIVALAAWLFFGLALTPSIRSASAPAGTQTGTVEGRVQNEVTGRYLNSSRVSVKGTDIRTLTDESGRYLLTNVPSGNIVLEVIYSGLERQELPVSVPSGQSVTRNVMLAPPGGAAVKMTAFEVESTRITDQATIAINEQRFAPNIKTVVSTGDLSEHVDGNIAEFLKFVPGVSTDDSRPGGSSISIRGFPSNLTEVTEDGAATANAPLSGTTRTVGTRMTMSITNVARVEVTKVPTPSTGADTMAGSVNLVSRNAFESDRRKFSYTATIAGEHTYLMDLFSFKKTPSIFHDKDIYYTSPSISFTHAHPVSKNFGYTVSGLYDKKAMTQLTRIYNHNFNSSTYGASPEAPMLNHVSLIRGGQVGERIHMGATADWRVTPNSVLSIGGRAFNSENHNGGTRVNFTAGTNANPTVEGGVRGSYGPDFTIGATGRGQVQFRTNAQLQYYDGLVGNLRYKFNDGNWKIDLKTSQSKAKFRYRTLPEKGMVRNNPTNNSIPLRIEFHNHDPITGPGPGGILVYNNNEELVDTSVPSFLDDTELANVTTLTRDVTDEVGSYNVDIGRNLDFLPFPTRIQVGGARKDRDRNRWNENPATWTYRGINGDLSGAPFSGPSPLEFGHHYPDKHVVVSQYKIASAWTADPDLFFQTPAQLMVSERARRQNAERIRETADALYLQAQMQFMNNRLNVLTGVRYERTHGKGEGALNTPDEVWLRNADRSFVLDASGNRVRNPDAGAVNSIEELDYIWHERAARSDRTYDGFYPSLHLTYNFTEKLQARAAYAKTYGRPNFNFIIPRTEIREFEDEATGTVLGGRLVVRNAGLLPWTADNYDLTLEYYTDQGGIFGANVFRKEVSNFFGSVIRDATAEELEEAGVTFAEPGEWEYRTTINVGDARIDGLEINMNQSLSPLDNWMGGWGKSFRVFANLTKIRTIGDRRADFTGFLPTSANWGFQFSRARVRSSFKWNYRSRQDQSVVTNIGPNGFNYVPARTHLDINLNYSLRPNLALFIQMRNLLKVYQVPSRTSDVLPDYARVRNSVRWDGISTNLGITGSF